MAADVYVQVITVIPDGDPVENTRISLHQSNGTLVTAQTTGADGKVFLGNIAEATYEIRITPTAPGHIAASSLQTITITGTVDQIFDVIVNVSSLETAPDEHFCRCSGYFMTSYGKAVNDLSMHFSPSDVPVLSMYSATESTKAILPESLLVKTDSDGFAAVDLLRGYEYGVYMEGYENIHRYFLVPDLSASSLPDVLFPVIDRVEYTDSGATVTPVSSPTLSLAVDASKELVVYTLFRSGLKLTGLSPDISVSSADEAVFTVVLGELGALTVTAVGVGTADLEIALVEPETGRGIPMFPSADVRGTLAVTVT